MIPSKTIIAPEHEGALLDDPAVIAVAQEAGVRSVSDVSELPESMAYLADTLPGIIFPHNPLDGGDPSYQLRPDVPHRIDPESGKPHKYIFRPDEPPVLSVHPRMKDRFDDDTGSEMTAVIVEGTKQYLVAVAYAPDNFIIAGIQGCWGWTAKDAGPLGDVDALVNGRDVVIVFDADFKSNRQVWDAGEKLAEHATSVGAKSVKFASVPGSGSTGLDDYLKGRAPDRRKVTLENILTRASKLVLRDRPAKKRKKAAARIVEEDFDFVSTVLGEVCVVQFESLDDSGKLDLYQEKHTLPAGVYDDGTVMGVHNVRRKDTLLYAAPVVTAVVERQDDLSPNSSPDTAYEIDIQVGEANDCTHHMVVVADRDLTDVRQWLRDAECSTVPLGRLGCTSSGRARIAEAIRKQVPADAPRSREVPHTGWVDHEGVAYWVDTKGGHGPDGKTPTVRAKLDGSVASIDIPDASTFSREQAAESMLKLIGITDYLVDPTSWIVLLTGTLLSLAGGHPRCALYLVGVPMSGKSYLTGGIASILSRSFTPESPMTNAEGTRAYIRDQVAQAHNCPIFIDDARLHAGPHQQDAQDDWIDMVIRIGYAGGGAIGGHKSPGASQNSWGTSSRRDVRPFVVLNGENQPPGTQPSTLERLLILEVTRETSMIPGGAAYIKDLTERGEFQPAIAWFLRYIAILINNNFGGDVGRFRSEMLDQVGQQGIDAAMDDGDLAVGDDGLLPPRVINVIKTFFVGAELVRWFLVNGLEIMSDDEASDISLAWDIKILEAVHTHYATNLVNAGASNQYLESIKQAVGSGRYVIGRSVMSGKDQLGVVTTIKVSKGEPTTCIALIPAVAAKIVGADPSRVKRTLKGFIVGGTDGVLDRVVKINGTACRCMVITPKHWDPAPYIEDEDEL